MKPLLVILALFYMAERCANPAVVQAPPGKARIFDLVINKKTTPQDFPDSLWKKAGLSGSPGKVPGELVLDSNNRDSKAYYFLSDEKFLKKDLPGFTFRLYYKFLHGDQVEKILQVSGSKKVKHRRLAMSGGDSDSYSLSTEFTDDSTFVETWLYKTHIRDNTHSQAYQYDSVVCRFRYSQNFDFTFIKQDSFRYEKITHVYYPELRDRVFLVYGPVFKTNGVKCTWEYQVKYATEPTESSPVPLVEIVFQRLIDVKSRKCLLEMDLDEYPNLPQALAGLENEVTGRFDLDINFDGYQDMNYLTELAPTGNQAYQVYIYNEHTGIYEHSEILSGGSLSQQGIELDKKKRIALYSYKSGYNRYAFVKVHFSKDGEILFSEDFSMKPVDNQNGEKIIFQYAKYQQDKLVEKKEKIIPNEGEPDELFFEWADYDFGFGY